MRAMPLEAGGAMHEVFAAVRLWQLAYLQGLPQHVDITASRIYERTDENDEVTLGLARWNEAIEEADRNIGRETNPNRRYKGVKSDDQRDHLAALCFSILHSGGFYDDPNDPKRTITNMELATLSYIDERLPKLDNWSIHVADQRDPHAPVGIEWPFDVVLTYSDGDAIRYIGTIDGLCVSHNKSTHFLDENKTASRLDDGWRMSFEMSHQVTGYMAATTAIFGVPCFDAHIFGVTIGGARYGTECEDFTVSRTADKFQQWAAWVKYVATLDRTLGIRYDDAIRFTHSCNRYFRPCALIDFCADTAEGRAEQWAQMVPVKPSPSERAVFGRTAMHKYEGTDEQD